MLQRDPFEGARRSVDEIHNRNRALFCLLGETVVVHVTSAVSVDVLIESESAPPFAAAVEVAITIAVVSSSISISSGSVAQPNWCATCRKRVGLTGFKCRCGVTFCGAHRYPEEHACGFDFKTVGREEIARANPVIKAEKLRRI